jgi:hypothetical protein
VQSGARLPPAPLAKSGTAPRRETLPPHTQRLPDRRPRQNSREKTEQAPNQLLASKFRGAEVLGPDNQKIGDVSDILFNQSGKIDAYVVSIGGFLGVGSKEVAMAPDAFQIVNDDSAAIIPL